MPQTINLRAYLAKLDEQLRANATDEVILHCHHILQTFPKNIATYHLLGRALLYKARWQEADAILRRVLAVIPDDYIAHIGLCEIRQEQNRGNDAIWHLERALEQEPNNKELLASLTDLYKRYRGTEQLKIQLTAGAVAHQYARGGRYEQAAETLRSALENQPGRMDLRTLMAQMLWEAGRHVEAAEVALDVLETLPDCLQANLILARLWLEEDRPSDAQRYVNRLESLDPYLALEVATGATAPDEAFVLTELDYRRHAEEVLTSTQPDWLQELGGREAAPFEAAAPETQSAEDVWGDYDFPSFADESVTPPETSLVARTGQSEPPAPGNEADIELSPDDLAALIKPTVELESVRQERPDTDLRFDDPVEAPEQPEATSSIAARELKTETSSLASIFAGREKPDEEPLPDWLATEGDTTNNNEDEDPLAWLRESGVEIDDNIERPGFRLLEEHAGEAEPNAPPDEDEDDEDPFAWMRERGIILDDEEELSNLADRLDTPAETELTEEEDFPLAPIVELKPIDMDGEEDLEDDEDPFAWMRERGIEIEDEPVAPVDQDPFETQDDMPIQDPASDPLGWMQQYEDIVWTEDEPETPVLTASVSENEEAPATGNENPYAWLYETGQLEGTSPDAVTPVEDSDDEDDFSWLQNQSLLDELDEAQNDINDITEKDAPDIIAGVEEEFDWLKALSEDHTAGTKAASAESSAAIDATADTSETNILNDDRITDVLSDTGGPANAPAQQEAVTADRQEDMSDQDKNPTPDWLGGQNEQPVSSSDTPDWLKDFQDDESETAAPEPAEMPDWLSELKPETEEDAAPILNSGATEPQSAKEGFDEFEWMSSLEGEITEEASAQPEASETPFEWNAEPPGDVQETGPDASKTVPGWLATHEDEELSVSSAPWMSDFELDETDDQDQPLEPEIPDWLSELQPPTHEAVPQTPAVPTLNLDNDDNDAEFGWIDELIEKEESGQGTIAPLPTSQEDDDFVWSGDFAAETGETATSQEPDWLASLTKAEAAPDAGTNKQASGSEFEWISDVEADERETATAVDVPDWLKELEPDTGIAAPVGSAEPVQETDFEEFAWASEIDNEENAAADVTPEWLNQTEAEAEPPHGKAVVEEDATIVTVQPGEEPSWLAESLTPQATTEEPETAEQEEAAAPAEFELEAFEEAEDAFAVDDMTFETEHRPAQNAPDWLNAMVPGVDLDYEPTPEELEEPVAAAEPAPAAEAEPEVIESARPARDFDWLNEIVEEETQPAPEPSATTVIDEPAEEPASPFVFSKPPAWLRASRAQ